MTTNAGIAKKIEVKGDYVYITLERGRGTSDHEWCRYQIKVEDEGIALDAVERMDDGVDELIPLNAYDHVFETFVCPECEDSEVPGRIYNNNDPASGQYHNCNTCNASGDQDHGRREHVGV